VDKFCDDDLSYLMDAALDSISSYAPIVKTYKAEQENENN
jgi:hypothetical protein